MISESSVKMPKSQIAQPIHIELIMQDELFLLSDAAAISSAGDGKLLNDYQRQFLAHFIQHQVRFLVIGGVARWHYFGKPTRDLDVVVDIERSANGIERALEEWKREHPIHTMLDLSPPLALRPMAQIKFPDDLCAYRDDKGDIREIGPEDGVDVLTSLQSFSFAELYERSTEANIRDLTLRLLCPDDLERTATIRQLGGSSQPPDGGIQTSN
ncbi:hypothetical protein ELG66_01015 [Rhizobium leguminosarum]|uniref:hypothetical protein n=1 Tax=Rhizobium leguminosarum TaxID=384 RepID=UPI00102F3EE6|nr:hypothetical protein [Rhizobium leguminosarum]TBH34604.1 hypothetical protein ELG66_01015 [Rhizobium leguminosarum]